MIIIRQKEFTSKRLAKKLASTAGRIQRNAVKAARATNQVEAEKALDSVKNNRLVKKYNKIENSLVNKIESHGGPRSAASEPYMKTYRSASGKECSAFWGKI